MSKSTLEIRCCYTNLCVILHYSYFLFFFFFLQIHFFNVVSKKNETPVYSYHPLLIYIIWRMVEMCAFGLFVVSPRNSGCTLWTLNYLLNKWILHLNIWWCSKQRNSWKVNYKQKKNNFYNKWSAWNLTLFSVMTSLNKLE